ncbi:sporulation-delaying protein SdpB family protein (plasmid) [Macrococcoides bohemicum]|uniref:sporulation-delaying protein SdpB family protein n=1 Tax=Macrococcoides bohemicum TaxID=1903056 RepID=UPI003B00BAC1
MLNNIGDIVKNNIKQHTLWSNVYGLARSLMAFSLLMTLVVNDVEILFKPIAGIIEYPNCSRTNFFSLFCLVGANYTQLNIIKWLCILLLFLVVIGWRPRITGIFHWIVAFSVHSSAVSLDGGEQVNAVFSLLLLPITLTDNRKWHWQKGVSANFETKSNSVKSIIAYFSYIALRVQASIIYLQAPIAKVKTEDWLNGTAIYYFFEDGMLGTPDFLKPFLNPILESSLVVIPTWGTLIVQILLFLGLFAPKKYWKYLFVLGILLHTFIALIIGLYSFSLIMFGVLILYLVPFENTKYIKNNILIRKLQTVGYK